MALRPEENPKQAPPHATSIVLWGTPRREQIRVGEAGVEGLRKELNQQAGTLPLVGHTDTE